jgi:hypothetical protein
LSTAAGQRVIAPWTPADSTLPPAREIAKRVEAAIRALPLASDAITHLEPLDDRSRLNPAHPAMTAERVAAVTTKCA